MKTELIVNTLSDGSKVFNVLISVDGKSVLVGCTDYNAAIAFTKALHECVSWIELD